MIFDRLPREEGTENTRRYLIRLGVLEQAHMDECAFMDQAVLILASKRFKIPPVGEDDWEGENVAQGASLAQGEGSGEHV